MQIILDTKRDHFNCSGAKCNLCDKCNLRFQCLSSNDVTIIKKEEWQLHKINTLRSLIRYMFGNDLIIARKTVDNEVSCRLRGDGR